MVVVMIDYKPVVCEIFWHDNQVAMCTVFAPDFTSILGFCLTGAELTRRHRSGRAQ